MQVEQGPRHGKLQIGNRMHTEKGQIVHSQNQAGMHTYGLGITDHNVEDALRHAGAVCQLSQRKGGEWRRLCRLQDNLRSATFVKVMPDYCQVKASTTMCR